MENLYAKTISYLMLIVCFIVATSLILIGFDIYAQRYVSDKTNDFVDTCRSTGKITQTQYEAYIRSIEAVGDYSVDIQYDKKVYYPSKSGGESDYYTLITEDVLNNMNTTTDHTQYMSAGDRVTVTVKTMDKTLGQRLLGQFVTINPSYFVTKYGGGVGN